jgi:hypothetical protein
MASGQPVTANSSLGVMTLDAATSASITGANAASGALIQNQADILATGNRW